ncbi:MAG: DNA methylase [Clostridiales bacterium]|nr:DNA methylase [Clostridiales bacterium]
MGQPVYIAIDLKSYYASVECVERGENPLTFNLLVADETRTDKTICLAVSPSLKAIGVPSRPRLFEAKQAIRLYEAQHHSRVSYVVAKPQMALYEKVSAKIYSIYLKYVATTDIHVYSIDEVFIEATHYMDLYGKEAARANMSTPHYLAMTMIRDVLKNTGITATAGIGTNLYLAKVAMDIVAKKAPPDKDGVRIAELDEMSYRMLLWCHQPLTAFWQVGPGKARRLARYGIYTMGDIAQMSVADEEFLYRLFGIDAEILIDHAWGMEPCTLADIKNYRPKANSRSVGQVLPRPYKFDEARLVFSEMIDQLALDLVTKGVKTKELSFWVSFDPVSLEELPSYDGPVSLDYYGRLHPGHVVGTVRLRAHTSSTKEIMEALLYAFDMKVDHRLLIRRLGVAAGNLQEGCVQLDIFTDYAAQEREERLQQTLLAIRRKYSGPKSLIKGKNMLEGATAIERSQQIGGHKM